MIMDYNNSSYKPELYDNLYAITDGCSLFAYNGGGDIILPNISILADCNNDGKLDDVDESQKNSGLGKIISPKGELALINLSYNPTGFGILETEFGKIIPYMDGFTATLRATEGAELIKIWKDIDQTIELKLPMTYTIGKDVIPSKIYVQGIDYGTARLQTVLKDRCRNSKTSSDVEQFKILDNKLMQENNEDFEGHEADLDEILFTLSDALTGSVSSTDNGDGTMTVTVTHYFPPGGTPCDPTAELFIQLQPDGDWIGLGVGARTGNNPYTWTWTITTCPYVNGTYNTRAEITCGGGTKTGSMTIHNIDIDTDSNNDGTIDPDDNPKTGTDDPIETNTPGRMIAINTDDDNNNSTSDKDETGTVNGENDLALANIYYPVKTGYKVSLVASSGSDKIKVWKSSTKGTNNEITVSGSGTTFTIGTDSIPSSIYIEGFEMGTATLDLVHKTPTGSEICRDSITITVSNVIIESPTSFTKVLISKRSDTGDSWPSSYQTENRKITITAKTVPTPLQGVDIYFRSFDPDDKSQYETDTSGDDNLDTNKYGTLSLHPGFSGGSNYATTDSNGEAKMDLTITNRCAGDNYIVAVTSPNSVPDNYTGISHTAPMVAWKRVYVEKDKMYKVGSDLSADFPPDDNDLPDTIYIVDTSVFSVGDSIVVFDADHPDGESASIVSKTSMALTLDIDLDNYYDAGYSPGKGAAVAKPSEGYYEADLGRLTNAFGSDIEGTDGGCFVEFLSLPDGSNAVPYKERLSDITTTPDIVSYSQKWYKNKNKSNYIHVVGAKYCYDDTIPVLGMASSQDNCQYTYVETIKNYHGSNVSTVIQDTTAHEMGHKFTDPNTTDQYHSAFCHLGSADYCVMSYSRDREDSITEFCTLDPNTNVDHLSEIREATDPR